MTNVLKHEKQEEIRALGRLGWSLRRIEEATGVRRETIARYLGWSGIRVRPPRGRKLGEAKAASEVATDLGIIPAADSKPANGVATDLERCVAAGSVQSASLSRSSHPAAIWSLATPRPAADTTDAISEPSMEQYCVSLRLKSSRWLLLEISS